MTIYSNYEFFGTEKEVKRIVSLVPSFSKSIDYLGLQNFLVGITDKCEVSSPTQRAIVGGFAHANLEKIIACKPDLVLMFAGLNKDLRDQIIEKTRAMVIVSRPSSYDNVVKLLQKIVSLCDCQDAQEKLSELLAQSQKVQDKVKNLPKKRTFRLMHIENLKTCTPYSFQYDMIERAGGQPFPIENPNDAYQNVSLEEFIDFDPQFIVSCGARCPQELKAPHPDCQSKERPCQRTLQHILDKKEWQNVLAIKEQNIYFPSCLYICHPGVYMILGIEKMARILHPQAFKY